MKQINTIDGYVALVSDEDYDFINDLYQLTMNKDGYVNCNLKCMYKHKKMGLYSGISLHKLLIHPEKSGRGINVDHKDGNKLNNCRDNLRVCTHAENMRNRRKHKKAESKYKGVNWHKGSKAWQVRMNRDDKRIYKGLFSNEVAAANCYNYHAKIMYKEFAEYNDTPYMTKAEWESYQLGKDKSSKYRGVTKGIKGNWIAQIWDSINKKNLVLGEFETQIDAAIAWNEKAIELRGKDTYLNIIV
ncbi:HNH endonuclease [Neobacillus vireti]|uniref:HNH endonuclease n=1 Tax=Neobacillus vireti TaxID=220686 RepID=UPI002FFE6BBC